MGWRVWLWGMADECGCVNGGGDVYSCGGVLFVVVLMVVMAVMVFLVL